MFLDDYKNRVSVAFIIETDLVCMTISSSEEPYTSKAATTSAADETDVPTLTGIEHTSTVDTSASQDSTESTFTGVTPTTIIADKS